MKKTIQEILFSKELSADVSREMLKEQKGRKERYSNLGLAICIAYVLKYKQTKEPVSDQMHADLALVKQRSLGLYRQYKARPVNRWLRVSVVASLLLLFAVGGYWLGRNPFEVDQPEILTFATPIGQQSELTLPDGTFVALNYESTLKYRISQKAALQEVELDGEAFFKVAKNKKRTFRVITRDMSINVLGTEFNVKAYLDDRTAETTLLNGSIEIKDIQGQDEKILLHPGEKWSYDSSQKKQRIMHVNASQSALWRDGEYYFDKISLGDLSRVLERMYQVHIRFQDDRLQNELYSGIVFQQDNPEQIFEFIKLTLPIEISERGNVFVITRK